METTLNQELKATFLVFYKTENKVITTLKDAIGSSAYIPEIRQISAFSVNEKTFSQTKIRFEVSSELWIRTFTDHLGVEYSPKKTTYIVTLA